jgi:hypothetical protein
MVENEKNIDIWESGLKELVKTPGLIIPILFMLLCGYVLSFLLFQTNKKFAKHASTTGTVKFNLALGFCFCSIIMIIYHLIAYKKMISNIDELNVVALPCALILGGIVCLIIIFKAIKQ